LSIVDTTDLKINQAWEIYNWIATNIRYDVKAFLEGSHSNKTADVTIRRRKGVCYDYALLFKEMCASVNIECYLVNGYSKGAEFYKGSRFYRADHCWNTIYIDTTWLLADATWGSGYLEKFPTFYDKWKFKLFGIPYVNKKLKFVQMPVEKYFNPPYDSIRLTHMPLDPVWQIRERPYSIASFESDSSNQTIFLSDYKDRLRNVRKYSEADQAYTEGINGHEFNRNNNFDLALGYQTKAEKFEYNSTEVDSSRLGIFRETRDYFIKSVEFISLYRKSIDSSYSDRINQLKGMIKDGKSLGDKIAREYKSEKKSYQKKQVSLSNRYTNLLKRIEQYDAKLREIEKDSVYSFYKIKISNPDSMALINNKSNLTSSFKKFENLRSEIDSSILRFNKMLLEDSVSSLNCLQANRIFGSRMTEFKKLLDEEDNLMVATAWNKLYFQYKSSKESQKLKGQKITIIQGSYSKLILDISLFVSRCQNQAELINTYYKYTGDSLKAANMYLQTKKSLEEVNREAKELTYQFRDLNGSLYRFNEASFISLTDLIKPSGNNTKQFVAYESELLEKQKLYYRNEKANVKEVTGKANTAIVAINNKFKKYEASKPKINEKK